MLKSCRELEAGQPLSCQALPLFTLAAHPITLSGKECESDGESVSSWMQQSPCKA